MSKLVVLKATAFVLGIELVAAVMPIGCMYPAEESKVFGEISFCAIGHPCVCICPETGCCIDCEIGTVLFAIACWSMIGLCMPKVCFNSNGLLVSRLKASRRALICC